ncbi:MAG: hypothetical protein ACJ739_01855 [Acidimicrobiales bacterium]
MAAAGSKPPSNVGCVIAIIALPVVILVGVIIGTVLRSDDGGDVDEDHVALQDGDLGGTAWRVDAVRDVEGETCVFLYEGEAEDPLNGTCDLEPQDVTYDDHTVVFGRVQPGTAPATVELSNGEVIEVDTQTVDGMDGGFYVTVVDDDVDAVRLAG